MIYDELVVRLTLLDGPDREVDWLIHHIEMGPWLEKHGYKRVGDGYITQNPPIPGAELCSGPDQFTASVDAAIALAERVLPGWGWRVQNCGQPAGVVVKDDDAHEGLGSTPAIALCIAILCAKEAMLAASPLGEKR